MALREGFILRPGYRACTPARVVSFQSGQRKQPMNGDEFRRRWAQSEHRADRLRQQYEGTQSWSGSPQDYEDVLGPERSGGVDKVVNGPNPGRFAQKRWLGRILGGYAEWRQWR